jgi:hypothetical protein
LLVAFPAVTRNFKLVVVAVMLLLVPLRAMPAVTLGTCGLGKQPVSHNHAHDAAESAHHHEHTPKPQGHGRHDCNACAEHCASASIAVAAIPLGLPTMLGSDRILLRESFAAGFIPEHLDPPPLAV